MDFRALLAVVVGILFLVVSQRVPRVSAVPGTQGILFS